MKKASISLSFILLSLILCTLSGCEDTPSDREISTAQNTQTDMAGTWNLSGMNSETTSPSPNHLAIQFGAQIAVDEINAEGGINGVLLAFCFDDSADSFRLTAADSSVDIWAAPKGTLLVSLPNSTNDFEINTNHGSALQFIHKYQQMYGSEPDIYATSAYDCVYLLKTVLEQSNTVPSTDMTEIIDIFQTTIPEINFEGLSGCEVLLGVSHY